MTTPHGEGYYYVGQPSRWRFLGPLTALAAVCAVGTLIVLFLTYINWAFGGHSTPAGDFALIGTLFAVGVAPAVVLLVLSLRRRPERRGGVVISLSFLIPVSLIFAPFLVSTGERYAERLHAESLPLLPSETAFTVDEATAIAVQERDAAIAFLDIRPDSLRESSVACGLSTGVPGTMPFVTAELSTSDWPTTSIETVPDALRLHWEELGYDVTINDLSDTRLSVVFVADGEPALTGSALWEASSLRFRLRVDGPCLKSDAPFSGALPAPYEE